MVSEQDAGIPAKAISHPIDIDIPMLNADSTARLEMKSEDGLTSMGRLKFVTEQMDIITKLGDAVKVWVRRKIDKSIHYRFIRPRTSRLRHHGTSRFARFMQAQAYQQVLDEQGHEMDQFQRFHAIDRIRRLQA